ncbi:purine-cytosine permease (2.A.39) family protein [Pleurotus pulmonarius]
MVNKVEAENSIQPTRRIILLSTLAQRLRRWGVETRGIQPIPETERTDTRYNRIFFIWLSSSFNIRSFSVGAVSPSYGLRLKDACAIILFFNMFFILFPAYLCTLGPKLGFRQMVYGRYSFGYFGVILPCLLNMMTALGYAVLTCIVGGQALSAAGDGGLSLAVGITIVGIASLALTFCGYKVLSWFDQLAWIPAFIVCPIMIGVGAKHLSIGDGPTPTLASVFNYGVLVGAGVSWSAASSDFTSHFPPCAPSKRLFWYAYLGIIIPTTSMSILGAAFGASVAHVPSWQQGFTDTNVGGFIAAILEPTGNFGKFLMVLLALGVIANIATNLYCFCVNVEVFLPILLNTPRFIFSLVAAAIVIPVAIVGSRSFSDTLGNFLSVIAYWSGPFAAILSTEHLLFRRGRQENYDINKWNSPSQLPTGLAALAAGAIGTTMGILCMNQAWYVGPIAKTTGDIGLEVSLATAFVMYIPFRSLEVYLWRDIHIPSLKVSFVVLRQNYLHTD